MILIVTSYNPDTHRTSENLSTFADTYKSHGGSYRIAVETLNCKNLSEVFVWKKRMAAILSKYKGEKTPAIIILLGQEAWSAFLSQKSKDVRNIPTMCAMVSRNILMLPEDTVTCRTGNRKIRTFILISLIIRLWADMFMSIIWKKHQSDATFLS